MMGIWRSLAGTVTVELTSADTPASLRQINELGIRIFDVEDRGDLSVRFGISRKDHAGLAQFAQRKGLRLDVIRRKGIYWDFRRLLHRPVLTVGIMALLLLMGFLPTRVLFVEVEGNTAVPARLILSAAEESGICFGASRREVRSEKMKNALLSAVPELQWAGVNTYGCTAVITVRERSTAEATEQDAAVSSIVAARDGVILSCTVTHGNGLCAVGQAVQAGQVLISGYTDCGLSVIATRAEGEIMARTKRSLTVKSLSDAMIRGTQGQKDVKYSICFGKNRINFYKGSGISDASCVKMYSEYALTLPGGFTLPVTLVKETTIETEVTPSQREETAAFAALASFAERYLKAQMIAGSITDRSEGIAPETGCYVLTGDYACTEMIGRRKQEQIGEYHETD